MCYRKSAFQVGVCKLGPTVLRHKLSAVFIDDAGIAVAVLKKGVIITFRGGLFRNFKNRFIVLTAIKYTKNCD